MYSKLAGLAAASAGALAVAAAAVAAPPATMSGETFLPGTSTTVNTCSPDGGSATIDFDGVAAGPYAGTYTAHVALRYAAAVDGSFTLSGAETFYISSGTSTIDGRKVISGTGHCVGGGFALEFSGTYTATIATSAGRYDDAGTVTGSIDPTGTTESFVSTQGPPALVGPTDKAQCKKDGWTSFGVFKNQGACVKYVETGKVG